MAPRRQGATDMETHEFRGCCVPGDCLRPREPVRAEDAVRVTCNNDACLAGRYMHRDCFDHWEAGVLAYLKSTGRARSWNEKQRHQNLWTKKGYDLAYKACNCRCGRGHLKKDLDWVPPQAARVQDDRRRRRRTRSGRSVAPGDPRDPRPRGSFSSGSGTSSPPTPISEPSTSPIHAPNYNSTLAKRNSKTEILSDKVRAGAGANGIFSRRINFSTFNHLPRYKVNSYQIKTEDEGNHGNDETRQFILTTLANHHTPKVNCVLCKATLDVFDQYPLVHGTFFLSPKQHIPSAIEVKIEGRTQYLTCVCLDCLHEDSVLSCRFCYQKWNGSSIVLGTMYSYDIFMATPCCFERLRCNNCCQTLLTPHNPLNYSDYSHPYMCPHCRVHDIHFVKPLQYCFSRPEFPQYKQWA